jgi:hypothetical protein
VATARRPRDRARAVDEYLASTGVKLFLSRIDYTGRLAVKLEAS